ncbi:unnamed protein product, partial [Mesorhabditis belari]|uniref:Uncharacterized protein n=1 Tax=Mesorhabditis belari TaxID=2138241 RepID=A0AAF3FCJ4_9BILA
MAFYDKEHLRNLNVVNRDHDSLTGNQRTSVKDVDDFLVQEDKLRAEFHENTKVITKGQKIIGEYTALNGLVPKIETAHQRSSEQIKKLKSHLEEERKCVSDAYKKCAIDDRSQAEALEALKIRWEEQMEKIDNALEEHRPIDLEEGREKYASLVAKSELTGVALESLDDMAKEFLALKMELKKQTEQKQEAKERERKIAEETAFLKERIITECPQLADLLEQFLNRN